MPISMINFKLHYKSLGLFGYHSLHTQLFDSWIILIVDVHI